MDNVITALLAALIIIIIYRWIANGNASGGAAAAEHIANVEDVIFAVEKVQRDNGSFKDFQQKIGDPLFPIYKYAQLVTLQKTNKLTPEGVLNVLTRD